ELARDPFAPKLRGYRRIDRRNATIFFLHSQRAGGAPYDAHVLVIERSGIVANRDGEWLPVLERSKLVAGKRGHGLRREWGVFAELLTQRPEVRFRMECNERIR